MFRPRSAITLMADIDSVPVIPTGDAYMDIIRFQPIYQERIWGGRTLERFGRDCFPAHGRIGESWEICDRSDANTRVKVGPLAGYSLRELMRHHGREIMGGAWHPERPFPLLVKWLDSRERLSLQVHPPLAVTEVHGGEPKTETWYVADAEPGAGLFCGLKRGATRERFESALRRNAASELVHRVSVSKGDALHTPSGRIHAIDAGCLILEIQQNSDTTYRVYDWGRPRALHIDESLRCINFEDFEPEPLRASASSRVLVECEYYRLREVVLSAGASLRFEAGAPHILSVVTGSLVLESAPTMIGYGENLLIPASSLAGFVARSDARVLVTDRF